MRSGGSSQYYNTIMYCVAGLERGSSVGILRHCERSLRMRRHVESTIFSVGAIRLVRGTRNAFLSFDPSDFANKGIDNEAHVF